MRLLVTRPELAGRRTAETLRRRGHEVALAPLLRVEPVKDVEFGPGAFAAAAVTSANALCAVAAHARLPELKSLPLFVVGRHTAETARAMGFLHVASADGNQQDLARLIAAHLKGGAPLLYLAGEDRSGDLSGRLAGIAVRTVVTYRAVPAVELAPAVRDALAKGVIEGVLHFSKRSAGAFVSCARGSAVLDAALGASHYCLSRQVAEPLAAAGVSADRLHVAVRPDEAALVALLDQS